MTTTQKITFSGGFHSSADITVRAKIGSRGELYLSRGQYSKLQKHFCGIESCECGGVHRADHDAGDLLDLVSCQL